jgi:uncharacterized protein with HEPN domain
VRDDRERILDMLEAVERIKRQAAKGRPAFERDELLQVWIVHWLLIIGEAAARLGRAFHMAHPVVPWAQVVAMRNVLVHDYFGIDLEEVWLVVERDLPQLEKQLRDVADELGRNT